MKGVNINVYYILGSLWEDPAFYRETTHKKFSLFPPQFLSYCVRMEGSGLRVVLMIVALGPWAGAFSSCLCGVLANTPWSFPEGLLGLKLPSWHVSFPPKPCTFHVFHPNPWAFTRLPGLQVWEMDSRFLFQDKVTLQVASLCEKCSSSGVNLLWKEKQCFPEYGISHPRALASSACLRDKGEKGLFHSSLVREQIVANVHYSSFKSCSLSKRT